MQNFPRFVSDDGDAVALLASLGMISLPVVQARIFEKLTHAQNDKIGRPACRFTLRRNRKRAHSSVIEI